MYTKAFKMIHNPASFYFCSPDRQSSSWFQNQSESKKLQPNVAIFLRYSTAIVGTLNKKYKVSIDLNN